MKTLRKNVDLDIETVAILMIESTLNGFGTLKPFLESILEGHAAKCRKARPKVYEAILEKKIKTITKTARTKLAR